MRALVTGGSGFVGRHLCRRLLAGGYEVVCVDPIVPYTGGIHPSNWPLFSPNDNARFQFVQQDCREYFQNTNEQFDYVFHLAAIVGGRLMIENDPLGVATDLAIDASLWNWVTKVRPGKVVYFSSSAAYPVRFQRKEAFQLLIEDMITFSEDIGMPDLTYGWSKLTGEYLARLAYEKYEIRSVVYRPFSGYGEDQDLSYPFPAICQRIIDDKGKDEVFVWGTGQQMRDFIYIEDCVTGILDTIDRIDNADAVNLSTGLLTSFRELASTAANIFGYDPRIVGLSEKPEGVFARGGDTKKQRDLGFQATTSLKTGIQRCLDYFLTDGHRG